MLMVVEQGSDGKRGIGAEVSDHLPGLLGGTEPDIVKSALRKIGELAAKDPKEEADALATLLALSSLRNIEDEVEQEWRAMNVELDIGGSRLLREPIEKAYADGRVGGAAEMVTEGLRQRFGDIPAELASALQNADEATLLSIMRASFTAGSMAEAVGPSLAEHVRP
jgi:hypothetical protein